MTASQALLLEQNNKTSSAKPGDLQLGGRLQAQLRLLAAKELQDNPDHYGFEVGSGVDKQENGVTHSRYQPLRLQQICNQRLGPRQGTLDDAGRCISFDQPKLALRLLRRFGLNSEPPEHCASFWCCYNKRSA